MDNLKEIRKSKNLSIEFLSKILKIPAKFIESLESGAYPKNIVYIIKLSEYLKVPVDSILGIRHTLSAYELKILRLFRKLNTYDKLKIEGMIEQKLFEESFEKKRQLLSLMLIQKLLNLKKHNKNALDIYFFYPMIAVSFSLSES